MNPIQRLTQLIMAGITFAVIWVLQHWKLILLVIVGVVLAFNVMSVVGVMGAMGILMILGTTLKVLLIPFIVILAFLGMRAWEKGKRGRAAIWWTFAGILVLWGVGLICSKGPMVCTNPQILVLTALLIGAVVAIGYLFPPNPRAVARTVLATILLVPLVIVLGVLTWKGVKDHVIAPKPQFMGPATVTVTSSARVPIFITKDCNLCLAPDATPEQKWEAFNRQLTPSPKP